MIYTRSSKRAVKSVYTYSCNWSLWDSTTTQSNWNYFPISIYCSKILNLPVIYVHITVPKNIILVSVS